MMHVSYDIFKLKADRSDSRDYLHSPTQSPLRETVDLRNWATKIEDQLSLGSCASNAMAGGYELLTNKEYPAQLVDLSRLFIYYNSRLLDGTVNIDSGVYLRDTLKAVKSYGICKETSWPYDISKFTVKPSDESYEDAKKRNIKDYTRLTTIDSMLDALNSSIPVLFGVNIYESFFDITAANNTVKLPDNSGTVGGHAMLLVGYDLPNKLFIVRNSFGEDWGISGYCWMTFEYLETELYDAWIYNIDLIETVPASNETT